jgi:hypothetical protein
MRIWALVAAMTAGALALYVTALHGESAVAGPAVPWWALAFVFLLAESFPGASALPERDAHAFAQ